MAASRAPVAVHPIQRGAHRGRLQPARRAFSPTCTLQPCVINLPARRGFFDLASTSLRTEARRVSLIRYRGFRSRRGTPGLRRANRGGSALRRGERVYMLLGLSRLPWAQLKDFDRQSRPRIETRTEGRGARWTYDVRVCRSPAAQGAANSSRGLLDGSAELAYCEPIRGNRTGPEPGVASRGRPRSSDSQVGKPQSGGSSASGVVSARGSG